MQFLSQIQNREIEQYAIAKGINLIERASVKIARFIISRFDNSHKILFVVGSGNNGSDGIAAAIKLLKKGYSVDIYRVFKIANNDNQNYLKEFLKLKEPLDSLDDINTYDVIVDAIFGIGLDRDLQGNILDIVERINKSFKYILALDVPSGLGAFNAKVYTQAVQATETITFLADKQGLHTAKGLDYAGRVTVAPLLKGSYIKLSQVGYEIKLNTIEDINLNTILRTKMDSNKGSFGNLALVGGNVGMHGALQLAGIGSLYSGCGKVSMISLDDSFKADIAVPELMTKSLNKFSDINYSGVVVGIGFGTDSVAEQVLNDIINNIEQPVIFDADALNIIARNEDIRSRFIELENKVITPHPAEAARLLNCTTTDIQDDRFRAVRELAEKYQATVILKGAGSLICVNNIIYINNTGNQGMAIAGQGDVLSGIVGSFLAQGLDTLSAARLAVKVHGLAGDSLVKQFGGYVGILPSKVAKKVSYILNKIS